jgi:hypothetical protein
MQQPRPELRIQQQVMNQHQFLPGMQQRQQQLQVVQQPNQMLQRQQMIQPQQMLTQEQEGQQAGGQAGGFGAGQQMTWGNLQQGEDMELADQCESGEQLYHLLQ